MKRIELRKMVLAAILTALGFILAQVFHALGGWQAGSVFLPMHITVLLCGLLCGWKYGMLSGLLTPMVGMLVTGMPNGNTLVAMEIELAAYGAAAGAFAAIKWPGADKEGGAMAFISVLFPLVLAMIIGRAAYGAVNVLLASRGDSPFTWAAFMAGAFTTPIPGIIIQLIVLPTLVTLFNKGKYLKGA
jgi:niacin transporter